MLPHSWCRFYGICRASALSAGLGSRFGRYLQCFRAIGIVFVTICTASALFDCLGNRLNDYLVCLFSSSEALLATLGNSFVVICGASTPFSDLGVYLEILAFG